MAILLNFPLFLVVTGGHVEGLATCHPDHVPPRAGRDGHGAFVGGKLLLML